MVPDLFGMRDPQDEIYNPRDIVLYKGLQFTVEEVRINGQIKIDNGEVLWPWECKRIAKQENMFADLGLPERNEQETVQMMLL